MTWEDYGLWCDAKAQIGEAVVTYAEWVEMEQAFEDALSAPER